MSTKEQELVNVSIKKTYSTDYGIFKKAWTSSPLNVYP